MKIQDFAGKNVCVLGYGREGCAMVEALEKHAPTCEITIADQNESIRSKNAKHWLQVGTGWLHNLDKFDVIIKSPGIPPHLLAANYKLLTNSTQIFLDTISNTGATVIGVTGSKGKSTTSSLIAAILTEAGKDVLLLGNIGAPAISHINDVKKSTYIVLEMSSYQLSNLTTSPHIAVVTSFFPEHLDYHTSATSSTGPSPLENYLDAKKNISRFQQEDDMVFFCEESKGAVEIAMEGHGRKIPFSAADAIIGIEDTQLIGLHNLSNIAAATSVTQELCISNAVIIAAIKKFKSLPHRLESIGIHHNMEWIDDAISTTPESTIAALNALGDRVSTIILGGQDRGYDFTELGKRIAQSPITTVILFPGSGPRIKQAINTACANVDFFETHSMEEAIATAKLRTTPARHNFSERGSHESQTTPIVLLSTASPSYGMFKNFEEKGDTFKQFVLIS